jgi:LEA14-like dessication related protein
MNKKKIIVTGIIIAAIGAATFYVVKLVNFTKKLYFNTINFNITSIGLSEVNIDADFEIKNKGKIQIDISELDLDIYLNEVYVGKMNEVKTIKISPNQTTTTPIQIALDTSKVWQNIGGILSSSTFENMNMRFKGHGKSTLLGIPIKLPINYEDKVKNYM